MWLLTFPQNILAILCSGSFSFVRRGTLTTGKFNVALRSPSLRCADVLESAMTLASMIYNYRYLYRSVDREALTELDDTESEERRRK